MAPPRLDTAERRRRLAWRHHLAGEAQATDPVQAADSLVGLHATDPASVYLEARARVSDVTPADMSRLLYDERRLLKILGMRRTMFVVPRELAEVITAAVARDIGGRERRRLLQWLEQAGVAQDVAAWLAEVEKRTLESLAELGEATASELVKRVPGLGVQLPFGEGKKWAGKVGVSTRVLFLLAAEGRVIRGRPRGSWVSSLYRWAPVDSWLEGGLRALAEPEARAALARRWLRSYGPAQLGDLQWWSGWTLGATRRALAEVGAVEVELDDGPGICLADDLEPTPPCEPWIALLPALDSTTMGWASRDWYLGKYRQLLFDRNGNAGPTVWADGRVVGAWAQRTSGDIAFQLLEDVGHEASLAIEREAAQLADWLGGSRIIPRFRTPSELELSA